MIFTELWTKGHINIRSVNDTGGFADLAEYIAKPLEEWEPEGVKRYHPSRNLIRKEPKQKVINRRSLVDKYGHMIYPKAPKGYYIDPESVHMGINPVTGFPYRHYTCIKLQIWGEKSVESRHISGNRQQSTKEHRQKVRVCPWDDLRRRNPDRRRVQPYIRDLPQCKPSEPCGCTIQDHENKQDLCTYGGCLCSSAY